MYWVYCVVCAEPPRWWTGRALHSDGVRLVLSCLSCPAPCLAWPYPVLSCLVLCPVLSLVYRVSGLLIDWLMNPLVLINLLIEWSSILWPTYTCSKYLSIYRTRIFLSGGLFFVTLRSQSALEEEEEGKDENVPIPTAQRPLHRTESPRAGMQRNRQGRFLPSFLPFRHATVDTVRVLGCGMYLQKIHHRHHHHHQE